MNLARTSRFVVKCRCIILNNYRSTANICTSTAVRKQESEFEIEKPYPFLSKMKEGGFKVEESFPFEQNYSWKYQPLVIGACFAIFLLYFCVLREPHDVDDAIAKHLYAAFPDLEVQDLKRDIILAKKKGKYTKEMEERLNTLQKK
ncbi:uncharacterized protein LOC132758987 [Ruditapes philippinarum]|uniref:uncharacterized protein LOC132758987 n=1 Tax=Ruditapes philippinarum TaxID=129788 RepID=UPI00295B4D65|nr:uncharacterized protein LOC132758987 [Ruditapes philippinarum]